MSAIFDNFSLGATIIVLCSAGVGWWKEKFARVMEKIN